MYERDIHAGHLWPALKASGITPSYHDWTHIREIEVGYAKAIEVAQERYQTAVRTSASAGKQKNLKQRVTELEEARPKGITAKIEQIIQEHANRQSPQQPQRDAMRDYLESTYSF